MTHTQALAGAYACGLALWAALTGDAALGAALGGAPEAAARAVAEAEAWAAAELADLRPRRAAVVAGGGPAWAAALELALMLKEIARIPAEGVETREGATSAMFGLDRGHLMVSLDPAGDPLGDEALRLCAATGAATLRLPGVAGADARLAPVTTLPAAAALAATLALAAGHDVDHPAWTDAYYETARSAHVSIRLGRGRLRQRLLDAVHEPDRAPARPGPRRGHRRLRRRSGQAARGRRAARPRPRGARRRRGLRAIRTSTSCSC